MPTGLAWPRRIDLSRDPAGERADDVAPPTHDAIAGVDAGVVDQPGPGPAHELDQLVDNHGRRIFQYLLQMTGNRHDAEDLTQDTSVKAFRSLQRGQRPTNIPAWLLTIARRTALNHFRAARPTEKLAPSVPHDSADPALVAAQADDRARLWSVARQLRRRHFEVLWLRYAEDLSVAEIAPILARHPIHVRVMLHRARAELRRRLIGLAGATVRLPPPSRLRSRTTVDVFTQRRVV